MGSLTLPAYLSGIREQNRRTIAKAITLVESTRQPDRALSQTLLAALAEQAPSDSFRVGISGPPGVGKSTFIEALGLHLLTQGKRVAILAVDPSSQRTGGSILGDKTRMGRLMGNRQVFIRPSPTGKNLGGVARKTRETILILEAAGFDTILVETVGVGQSETVVAGMVDFFTLLHLPNAGDDLQGIKRGIMEVADALVVNKADGPLQEAAHQAARGLKSALQLLGAADPGWQTPVLLTSAQTGLGIAECWQTMQHFFSQMRQSGQLIIKRQQQNKNWMWEMVMDELKDQFIHHPRVHLQLPALSQAVGEGRTTPVTAATILLQAFREKR
ncbi:MAG: methylmalonyl Co-A mutase-associated GTPase MeaB [Magnetococcales bacterium]|nr:methylmalonyl Co-A mutase-associated GTPase MeaB [Magnetococcales bacterium]